MSFTEAIAWSTYISKRGSLNWGMRLEEEFARLRARMANEFQALHQKGGAPVNHVDLMRHVDVPEATLADVMKELRVKG